MSLKKNAGTKHDSGKPPISLIPRVAIEQEALVMGFGAEKYGKGNWSNGLSYSRLIDACLRHTLAFADGEDNDPETGLSHLAHARCCLGMLLAMPTEWDDRTTKEDPEDDGRYGFYGEYLCAPTGATEVPAVQPEIHRHTWLTERASCLDAGYEREAMRNGSVMVPIFPENECLICGGLKGKP
jgi:hypothetical protein